MRISRQIVCKWLPMFCLSGIPQRAEAKFNNTHTKNTCINPTPPPA
uniref:Uncharacterized protein n=1 Tax=Rhizophora mucronata TaxID=61149 RepID=A0A2P2QB90_RHIMU